MASETKDNIEKKRKNRSRRRRNKIFRFIFRCTILILIFTAILFTGVGIYNVVNRAYNELNDMYAGYNERRAQTTGEIDPKFNGYTNILILGIDDSAEPNADTILVLSFSNDTGKSRLITIPRDTWVSADSSAGRIGTLYGFGGASLMVRHVSQLLGISIHQFVVVKMSTFEKLIDVLGGIDVYVPENMDYEDQSAGLEIHLEQGYQHLTGNDAQKYLRFRGGKLGDVGRVQRQQQFFRALYVKVLQLDTIPKLPAIADIFRTEMETSADIFDSAHLANVLRRMSSDPPQTVMLPGNEDENGAWIPAIDAIDKKISELFPIQEISEEVIKGEE